jgi:excisionase family DNA binding protein
MANMTAVTGPAAKPLLTTRQVAQRLNVSERKAQSLAKAGQIAQVDVGERSVRFTEEEVARYVRDHTRRPVRQLRV